jgi:hypothetical protein
MQERVHEMQAIKLPFPFMCEWRLALVHAKARAYKLACVEECVFLIKLLLKLLSVETSVQVYVISIIRLCMHASEYESGRAS